MHKFVLFLWKWTKRFLVFLLRVLLTTVFGLLRISFFAVLLVLLYAVSLLLNVVTLPLFLVLYIVCCLFKRNRPSLARYELTLYPSWVSSNSAEGSAAAGSASRAGGSLSANLRSRAKNSFPAGMNARVGRGNAAGTAGSNSRTGGGSSAGAGTSSGTGAGFGAGRGTSANTANAGFRTGKGASANTASTGFETGKSASAGTGAGSETGKGASAGAGTEKKAASAGQYPRSCVTWLKKQGYTGVKTAPSADNSGTELLAADSGHNVWVFCCRMSSSALGTDAVLDAIAARMNQGASCAGIITNAGLTDAARTLAGDNNVKVYEHISV